jgi:hypothetical protein
MIAYRLAVLCYSYSYSYGFDADRTAMLAALVWGCGHE